MAYRYQERTGEVSINNVSRLGLRGVRLDISYEIEGRKHTTCVNHKMDIRLCDMTYIGSQLQIIMDELLHEWAKSKGKISGTKPPRIQLTPTDPPTIHTF